MFKKICKKTTTVSQDPSCETQFTISDWHTDISTADVHNKDKHFHILIFIQIMSTITKMVSTTEHVFQFYN